MNKSIKTSYLIEEYTPIVQQPLFEEEEFDYLMSCVEKAKRYLIESDKTCSIKLLVNDQDGYKRAHIEFEPKLKEMFQSKFLGLINKFHQKTVQRDAQGNVIYENNLSLLSVANKNCVPVHTDKPPYEPEHHTFYKLVFFVLDPNFDIEGGSLEIWNRYIDTNGKPILNEFPNQGFSIMPTQNTGILFNSALPHCLTKVVGSDLLFFTYY